MNHKKHTPWAWSAALSLAWIACGPETQIASETSLDEVSASRAGDVPTQGGVLRGARTGQSWAWKGVAYAKAPIGALRFRPPAALDAWSGVREATAFGSACSQPDAEGQFIGSEDCLTLNIWAPVDYRTASLPVLFFIHGGGHQQGSSSQVLGDDVALYDGQAFVEAAPVVMVTINYRLGPFGFLAHPALSAEGTDKSGNYGMLDQIAALSWVHHNIAGFGGDPDRVMVFGESAGAVSTCRLVASPLARNLLSAAIMESGACTATSLATAEANGLDVAQEVGCANARDAARCLRRVSQTALLSTVHELDLGAGFRNTYDGVIAGPALPMAPLEMIAAGRHNRVPMILGTNTEEMGKSAPPIGSEAAYEAAVRDYAASLGKPLLAPQMLATYPISDYDSPRDAFVAMTSDIKFGCPTRKAIQTLAAAQSAPIYQYVYSHVADLARPEVKQLGATHGSELPFVFGTLARQGAGDQEVIAIFSAAWSHFAASGDPNAPGLPMWRRYSASREPNLHIDSPPSTGQHDRSEQCDRLSDLAD